MDDSAGNAPRFGPFWDGSAVRFSLPAPSAERVELCLFDPTGRNETGRRDLERSDDGPWTLLCPDLGPGQLYGYRVHGPFEPSAGHRFDPGKLLVDPAAPAVTGRVTWHPALQSVATESGTRVAAPSGEDSSPYVPRSLVVDPRFDWAGDARPRTPWQETLIYECHVRGATIAHPQIPPEIRGTYLALCHPAFIEHLGRLGVTAVELMPVQHFTAERHLAASGRVNYWGYSPLAFYAPHAGYATGDDGRQVEEFRRMVRTLHAAGIEVLIDVVLNHTCEGDARGPTLGLRGIDNRTYYLTLGDSGGYVDYTGCGHTLRFGDATVDAMALDCLRYWAHQMRVDGFRFDLAPVLGRVAGEFDRAAPFLRALAADPVLGRLKRIAEPWDLGPGGYRLGHFPDDWREWNDRFRDTVRAFWRGDSEPVGELEVRVAGSRDRLADPAADASSRTRSVNYVSSHDGFTLRDLVSYEERHNEANGEGNRDGHRENLSRNWGVEGPTDDPAIERLRARAVRNLLATLFLSDGTPMLGHGDELGRTQLGNNNPYCQDGPTTWIDWDLDEAGRDLLAHTCELSRWRREISRHGGREPWQRWEPRPAEAATPQAAAAGGGPVVAMCKPRAGFLFVLHNGEAWCELLLPVAKLPWSLAWSSATASAPVDGVLRVPPRSVSLLARQDTEIENARAGAGDPTPSAQA